MLIFRQLFMSHLLQVVILFGMKNSKLREHEVAHRYKESIIAHNWSRKRIMELFTCNEVSAFKVIDHASGNTYS